MKLSRFFLSILAGAALAAGCVQEQVISTLDEFKVDNSYLSLPLEGGIVSTTVKTTVQWSFDDATVPEWLTVTPRSGGAETTGIVFAADANTGMSERTANLVVNVGKRRQRFSVIQAGPGEIVFPLTPIEEVTADKAGQTFRIRGTVTSISSTSYGNLYVKDGTGTMYIYGLVNGKGQYPKDAGGWNTFGVEAGDIITVQGPLKLYGSTLELVDATLISVEKSLITTDPASVELESAEAGTFSISVVSKANGMVVLPSADWIKVTDIEAGEKDASVYKFSYTANTTTAARNAEIEFKATNSSMVVPVTQPGIPPTGQSITEIVALPDNSGVETLPSTVVAKTTKGFVISDGNSALYVYDKGENDAQVGDVVKVFGTKKTYNGIPEIDPVTSVEKDGTATVNYPSPKDVTADALTFAASTAEFIQFTGKLVVSDRGYCNVQIDGIDPAKKQGSIVSPLDGMGVQALDGKNILVTGYFNGLSGENGLYLNVIATKVVAYDANAKGSLANPYTPAEAADAVKDLKWTSNTDYEATDEVYMKGKICKIANKGTYTEGGTYGNASFYLSADGTGDGEFYVFRALYLGNKKFEAGQTDIKVGDEVVIYGKLMNYQNNTPETVSGKAYLYSLNGKTE